MHIISGKYRSRVIEMPKGIRPTSDRVREAIFEILKARIQGCDFLDIYCGSGAIGIEAFSRGAKSVTFVDNNPAVISILRRNLSVLGILNRPGIYIEKAEAMNSIQMFERKRRIFDILFLDPPYYKDIARNTLIAISNYDILARNAIIIAEVYKKEELPETIGRLKRLRAVRHGDTKLELYNVLDKNLAIDERSKSN